MQGLAGLVDVLEDFFAGDRLGDVLVHSRHLHPVSLRNLYVVPQDARWRMTANRLS